MGRGHAVHLKRELIEVAKGVGVETVRSLVDYRNKPMLELNEKLGAIRRPDPEDVWHELIICEIPVTAAPYRPAAQ